MDYILPIQKRQRPKGVDTEAFGNCFHDLREKPFPGQPAFPFSSGHFFEPEQTGPGSQLTVATGDSEYKVRDKLIAPKFVVGAWACDPCVKLIHSDAQHTNVITY